MQCWVSCTSVTTYIMCCSITKFLNNIGCKFNFFDLTKWKIFSIVVLQQFMLNLERRAHVMCLCKERSTGKVSYYTKRFYSSVNQQQKRISQ